MIIEDKIVDGFDEQEALHKSRIAHFRTLGFKFFDADNDRSKNQINLIKEGLQFNKLPLPSQFDENLIDYNFAPIYWVTSSPLVIMLENHIKSMAPKEFILDYFNYIKEFYFKWIIVDSPADKKYFAVSAINALKHTNNNNFTITNILLHSTILIFEKSLFNAAEAENQLNKALSLLKSVDMEDRFKKELDYMINIFYGFLFLKQNDAEGAIGRFKTAISIKPDGINATFYLALTYARLNNLEDAENFIRKVYEYDMSRISFAVEENHIGMFNRFVHKPVTAYFFEFWEFSSYLEFFKTVKERNENIASVELYHLRTKVSKLKELRLIDYFDDTLLESITFLESILQLYHGTENVLVLGASNFLVNKFRNLVEGIKSAVKKRANAEIDNKLQIYDRCIEDSKVESQRLEKELEQLKEKIKLRFAEKSNRVAKLVASKVKEIEREIHNLDLMEKFNHKFTFNNSITYSVIISFIVFMIGGLAGYANSGDVNAWDFKSVMSIVFSEGLKWAAVSIFIGTLISFVLSASTFLEKSNRKTQLMKEIGSIKKRKETEIENLKIIAEEREKNLEERFHSRIKEYNQRAEGLKSQKLTEQNTLRESAMVKYTKLDEQLAALIN